MSGLTEGEEARGAASDEDAAEEEATLASREAGWKVPVVNRSWRRGMTAGLTCMASTSSLNTARQSAAVQQFATLLAPQWPPVNKADSQQTGVRRTPPNARMQSCACSHVCGKSQGRAAVVKSISTITLCRFVNSRVPSPAQCSKPCLLPLPKSWLPKLSSLAQSKREMVHSKCLLER